LFGATGNVLITLLIGLGLLWSFDHLPSMTLRGITAIAGIALSGLCDWGIIGPVMILLFWHLHDRPRGSSLTMLVAALALGLPALSWAFTDPT
ncbi:hypothetical protein GUG51_31875, partial [Xanthomonas citri pv. citri]|nr:hypothetical protein [Xanthomonas citri pv. citri]